VAALRFIFSDQLSHSISSLKGSEPAADIILLCEVMEEATYVRHHPKKIAFLFSAMRHFAEELRGQGLQVRYVKLDDPANTQSIEGEIGRALRDCGAERIVATEPGEWRLKRRMEDWRSRFDMDLEVREDDRFMASLGEFSAWADGRKQLRMEYFYREMRKGFNILMDPGGKPVGGQWNYDAENRKPPAKGLIIPKRISHRKDIITEEVLDLVAARFGQHFGDLLPFHFAVTREQALIEARHFMHEVLPDFGAYQDAMLAGEPYMFHSLLAAYLNSGLLLPLELCQMAEAAYRAGRAPLNAAEGFIRQIMGWREFVRGLYWHFMPDYAEHNFFEAARPLPAFYWGAPTKMACVSEAVRHTKQHAYSHHIQRLMVTGNFALLAGLAPAEVCEWYLAVYADAFDWVELPNTLGMALFADGGIMASKPYAASGKYISRMSNFCKDCFYDPEAASGDKACPFNALYWDFIERNAGKLRGNQRLNYTFATLDRMSAEKRAAIKAQAAGVFARLDAGLL
jgi:deoxyribodipyrimidine photolyase-related protein